MRNILVVLKQYESMKTIDYSFGIDRSWIVHSVSNTHELRNRINGFGRLDCIMIDMDFGVDIVYEFTNMIRNVFPDVLLILVGKESPSYQYEEILPWKHLSQPFTTGDVLEAINSSWEASKNLVPGHSSLNQSLPDYSKWVEDRDEIKTTIVRVQEDLDIIEAFLFTNKGLIASLDKLDKSLLEACCGYLDKEILNNNHGEVIKFIQDDTQQYLFHAVILARGILLGFIYHADMPFSAVRMQGKEFTDRLNKTLLTFGNNPFLTKEKSSEVINNKPESAEFHTINQKNIDTNLLANDKFDGNRASFPEHVDLVQAIHSDLNKTELPMESKDLNQGNPNINQDLWAFDVPEPDPVPRSIPKIDKPHEKQIINNSLEIFTGLDAATLNIHSKDCSSESTDSIIHLGKVNHPIQDNRFFFPYACLLVLQSNIDLLDKEVNMLLRDVIGNIFLSHGWQLDVLEIEKESLQWVGRIPYTDSPAMHVQTVRRESSQILAEYFPHLARGGIKDVWAPRFVLQNNNQLISQHQVRHHIRSTQNPNPEDKIRQNYDSSFINIQRTL